MGNRKLLAAALVLPSLLAVTISGAASATDPGADNNGGQQASSLAPGPQALTAITVDGGWQFFNDCAIGTPCPAGPFTFTAPSGGACVSVTDVFLKEDQYSLADGAQAVGTTSAPFPDDATNQGDPDLAFADPEFSSGRFMVEAGARSIDVTRVAGVTSLAAAYIRVDSAGTGFCAPNLTATSFSAPPSAELGEVVGGAILVTVTNTGNADFPPGYSSPIGFYISTDSTIDTGDTLLIGGRENIGDTNPSKLPNGLPAGASWSNFLFSGASIDPASATGNVFIGVLADEFNSIAESNEADNSQSQAIFIGPRPDLVVDSLTHDPASPDTEDTIVFTAVVKNVGSDTAGASTLMFKIGGETPGTPQTLFAVPSLAPGQTATFIRNEGLSVAQSYINTATADYNEAVTESDEGNNTTTDSYTVTQATQTASLIYQIISLPANGTLAGLSGCSVANPCNLANVMVTYEPAPAFTGTDFFEYRVLDVSTGLFSAAAIVDLLVANPPGTGVTLTVDFLGSGDGDVSFDVGGSVVAICSDDCTESFGPGDIVKLQARPLGLTTFGSWGGACAFAGTSQIATIALPASGGSSCTATFNP